MSICPTCCAWAAACWAGGAERRRGSRRSGRVRYRAPDQVTYLQPIHVGKPAAVAPLEPVTPDQKRRWRAAELRRELRRELNARFAEARQVGDS